MDAKEDDRLAVKRNITHFRRRSLLISLPLLAVLVLGSTALQHRIGLPPGAAQALVLLPVSLLSFYLYSRMWNTTALGLNTRQRRLRDERVDGHSSRVAPFAILLLAILLSIQVAALVHHHVLPADQTAFNMVLVLTTAVLPWRPTLFGPGRTAIADEVAAAEYRRAALHGFLALVVLLLLALVYESVVPGTLRMSVPASLMTGALVLRVSLWRQNRAAIRGNDE